MFDLIADDLRDGIEPPELWTRFAFVKDLHNAMEAELPMLPVCVAYATRFPQWESEFETDYLIELMGGFQSDEEIEADLDRSNREEADRRLALSLTPDGRDELAREDEEFARMVDIARLRIEVEIAVETMRAPVAVMQAA